LVENQLKFQDIPIVEPSLDDSEKRYDALFLFEKPDVCFTVLEYLDSTYKTIYEEYIDEKSKKTYTIRIGEFNFQGLKCCGIGLVGHIFNTKFKTSRILPESEYNWIVTNKKLFGIVSKYIQKSRDFILCTDDDEEGELISYSILRSFGFDPYKYRRLRTYTFRNKDLFLEKLKTHSYLEPGKVKATMTRHILDMVWGKNFSRLLGRGVKMLSRGIHLSLGRVQTPTLRFIYDQLELIKQFKPETHSKSTHHFSYRIFLLVLFITSIPIKRA
jgi:DNA topoisomerase IA